MYLQYLRHVGPQLGRILAPKIINLNYIKTHSNNRPFFETIFSKRNGKTARNSGGTAAAAAAAEAAAATPSPSPLRRTPRHLRVVDCNHPAAFEMPISGLAGGCLKLLVLRFVVEPLSSPCTIHTDSVDCNHPEALEMQMSGRRNCPVGRRSCQSATDTTIRVETCPRRASAAARGG